MQEERRQSGVHAELELVVARASQSEWRRAKHRLTRDLQSSTVGTRERGFAQLLNSFLVCRSFAIVPLQTSFACAVPSSLLHV